MDRTNLGRNPCQCACEAMRRRTEAGCTLTKRISQLGNTREVRNERGKRSGKTALRRGRGLRQRRGDTSGNDSTSRTRSTWREMPSFL